jgi:DHA3 family macrolide efflux protein-like MFS transporter
MRDDSTSTRRFLVVWGGQALSLVGSQAVQFALIWWLARTSGSATVLAAASLVGLLPPVALGPVIGTLVDRWDRKRVLLAADGAVAAASLLLAALFAAGRAEPGHVLALLFVRALGGAFHAPALLASMSLMVPERHLTRVQGLEQGLQGLLAIVAAPLGAALLGILPMAGVMLVDVVTASFAILPLLLIAIPRPPGATSSAAEGSVEGRRPGAFLSELAAGFAYLWRLPGHRGLVGMATLVNLCLVPAFTLLPLLVMTRLGGGADELAVVTSALGAGILAGGVALGVWGGLRPRILTTLWGLLALGAAVVALGATPPGGFGWAIGAMLAVGLMVPVVNGPVVAILQATISPEYQGRVFALIGSLAGAAAPLGLVAAAPVAEAAGVEAWYVAGGVACLAMGLAGFAFPAIRAIESVPAGAVAGEGAEPAATF